jgi:hypothetical protein
MNMKYAISATIIFQVPAVCDLIATIHSDCSTVMIVPTKLFPPLKLTHLFFWTRLFSYGEKSTIYKFGMCVRGLFSCVVVNVLHYFSFYWSMNQNFSADIGRPWAYAVFRPLFIDTHRLREKILLEWRPLHLTIRVMVMVTQKAA